MRRAVEIGKRNPACPFGTVLVDTESWEIVAEGLNDSQSSPVRHGEIDAIERCAAAHPNIDWSKLWLYTTAEPCCMCQGAVLWAGIPRVIYGADDPKGGAHRSVHPVLVDQRNNHRPEVIPGVLELECGDILTQFFRMRRQSPEQGDGSAVIDDGES